MPLLKKLTKKRKIVKLVKLVEKDDPIIKIIHKTNEVNIIYN